MTILNLTPLDIPLTQKSVTETARYASIKDKGALPPAVRDKIIKTLNALHPILAPRALWCEYPCKVEADLIEFLGVAIHSKSLFRNLHDCKSLVLLAGTIGAGVDTFIRRAQIAGSSDALIAQAAGAMFCEELIDIANDKISQEHGGRTRPRFSCGYSDVPLETQRFIFKTLPCDKIGLTLMDTCIMSPEKSVTAFIGVE